MKSDGFKMLAGYSRSGVIGRNVVELPRAALAFNVAFIPARGGNGSLLMMPPDRKE